MLSSSERDITGYEVVRYTPRFKDQVVELQRHLWSQDLALNAAYLEWKHERNPYLDTPLIHLALHRGRVVGMRSMYGARWQVGRPSHTFVGPCAADFVISPEHRNRGLVSRILEASVRDLGQSDYPYVLNFYAEHATQLGSLMTGWRSTGPIETARWFSPGRATRLGIHRQMSRLPLVWRLGQTLQSLASARQGPPFRSLDRRVARTPETIGHVCVERTPRPEAMAELVERIGHDGRIRHVRDREYFDWRFRNPRSHYRFLFWIDARLEGYLVLRAPVSTATRGVSIVDWEATSEKVRTDLLWTALRWSKCDELALWSATLPADAKRSLEEAGFGLSVGSRSLGQAYLAGVHRPTILVRCARREMLKAQDWVLAERSLLDLQNWDLRMIYADL